MRLTDQDSYTMTDYDGNLTEEQRVVVHQVFKEHVQQRKRIAELEGALRVAIVTMECNDNFENADHCRAALEDKE